MEKITCINVAQKRADILQTPQAILLYRNGSYNFMRFTAFNEIMEKTFTGGKKPTFKYVEIIFPESWEID